MIEGFMGGFQAISAARMLPETLEGFYARCHSLLPSILYTHLGALALVWVLALVQSRQGGSTSSSVLALYVALPDLLDHALRRRSRSDSSALLAIVIPS